MRCFSISAAALVLACAARKPGSAEPPDPCEEPAGLRGILAGPGTFAAHERETSCRAQQEEAQRRKTTDDVAQARAQVETERAAWKAQEQAKAAAEAERAEGETERFRRVEEAREREAELTRYQEAVGPLDCTPPSWGVARMRYDFLRAYESSAERERALAEIERCRRKHLAWASKEGLQRIADKRKEFAISIEDDFDLSFPRRRGALVAKVDGSVLHISLKGELQGRPRHSEELVQNWCDEDDTQPPPWALVFMFSKVVLKDEHGTFSCQPSGWPGNTKGLFASFFLSEAEHPISTEPGTKPTPK